MATALKDIQFSNPVLNGTTANNKTTWTYGANDVVIFGCGASGCSSLEYHYGTESHCGCEYHCGTESHYGTESHCGTESHYGTENHIGNESHYGIISFGSSGCVSTPGWVSFNGGCYGSDSSYFVGTNMRAFGIAIVDPTCATNVVKLTYSELKSHGF